MKKVSIVLLILSIVSLLCMNVSAFATEEEELTLTAIPVVIQQPPAVTIDLTGIVLAVMTTLSAMVIKYLIPMLKTERQRKLAKIAVQAAEQLFTSGVIDDKLKYAEQWLLEKGIKADRRTLIEAAVAELNQYKQELDYQLEHFLPPDLDADSVVEEGQTSLFDEEEKHTCGSGECTIK